MAILVAGEFYKEMYKLQHVFVWLILELLQILLFTLKKKDISNFELITWISLSV